MLHTCGETFGWDFATTVSGICMQNSLMTYTTLQAWKAALIKFIKTSSNVNCDLPNQQKFPIEFIFEETVTNFSIPLLWIYGFMASLHGNTIK